MIPALLAEWGKPSEVYTEEGFCRLEWPDGRFADFLGLGHWTLQIPRPDGSVCCASNWETLRYLPSGEAETLSRSEAEQLFGNLTSEPWFPRPEIPG